MFATLNTRAEAWLSKLLPRYYLRHAAVALAISAVAFFVPTAWALAGAVFYLGREIRDRAKLGVWDWPGLLWPVGVCILLWVVFR
jgi:hypothetical protein